MSDHVAAFYDRHPISAAQILTKLAAERGPLPHPGPEDLFPYDQDHYGGLAAVEAIAARAGVGPDTRVLDMCAGLGGPARFLAARYGCAVVALERHAGRAAGAADLTRRVGLAGRMRVVRADALAPPFADASFDVVMSQEAFLHIADKPALLAGCHRLLAAGGRLVFTDWTATPALGPADRELMWRGIAAQGLLSADDYRHQLAAAGFRSVESEDLTAQWAEILAGRLRMYQGLREDARRATGADPHADYVKFYEAFVRLVQERRLGGARFVAVK